MKLVLLTLALRLTAAWRRLHRLPSRAMSSLTHACLLVTFLAHAHHVNIQQAENRQNGARPAHHASFCARYAQETSRLSGRKSESNVCKSHLHTLEISYSARKLKQTY